MYQVFYDNNVRTYKNLVDCFYSVYSLDSFSIICPKQTIVFDINDWSDSEKQSIYDLIFHTFVSAYLTKKERDRLILKIRGK